MADISQVKLPNGDTYNLVDETSGYITLPDLPVYDGTVVEDGDGYVIAPLILNVEVDETDPENPIVEITTPYSEIKAAYLSGRAVILDPMSPGGKRYTSMIGMYDFNPGGQVTFVNHTNDGYDVFGANTDASNPILIQDTNE